LGSSFIPSQKEIRAAGPDKWTTHIPCPQMKMDKLLSHQAISNPIGWWWDFFISFRSHHNKASTSSQWKPQEPVR
jgi:hypothetical protein